MGVKRGVRTEPGVRRRLRGGRGARSEPQGEPGLRSERTERRSGSRGLRVPGRWSPLGKSLSQEREGDLRAETSPINCDVARKELRNRTRGSEDKNVPRGRQPRRGRLARPAPGPVLSRKGEEFESRVHAAAGPDELRRGQNPALRPRSSAS